MIDNPSNIPSSGHLNPLIHDMPGDTLSHVEAMVSVMADLIDSQTNHEFNTTTPFGVQVMANCIRDALRYEANRSRVNHE